jgi:hypothetical protein
LGCTNPPHWRSTRPAWDTMGCCWMHSFWVKVGHSSATCSFPREEHCKDATCANTKGGSNIKQGGPKPPTRQGTPADSNKLEVADNHLAHYIQLETNCAHPYNLELTAYIDTAAMLMLFTSKAPASLSTHTNLGISVIQPGGTSMRTTLAIDLLLQNLPPNACMAHCLPRLLNNLLSVAVLCNAGCKVYFHSTGCEVTLNWEIFLRGWRDPEN